jgi:hypothetical protein
MGLRCNSSVGLAMNMPAVMFNIEAFPGCLVGQVAPIMNTASILDIRQFKRFIRSINRVPQ